jgi:hypothetical protein
VDALVPSISRVFTKSLSLRIGLLVLWVLGTTCELLALFDRFEPGSAQEWVACVSTALMLPVTVCIAGMLNAKTVWTLLQEFETLYVLACVLGMTIVLLLLFREHPAKLVSQAIAMLSML